jgi:carbonic anhydrase/acetyltransferase-like protein (isoleucine patch superfamily)
MERQPSVSKGCFVAPTANVLGSVKIGSNSNVWYGAVIRGDTAQVTIGENTNIKENALIGTTNSKKDITIGNNVCIESGAFIGAATIDDGARIGAGAVVSDGAHIQKGSAVAAGAVVSNGTVVPSGQARSLCCFICIRAFRILPAKHELTHGRSLSNYCTSSWVSSKLKSS